jgi:hypothetical protein
MAAQELACDGSYTPIGTGAAAVLPVPTVLPVLADDVDGLVTAAGLDAGGGAAERAAAGWEEQPAAVRPMTAASAGATAAAQRRRRSE